MQIQAKSFNGHTLWDGDYEATLLNPSALPSAKPVFIEESLADSDYSGMFTREIRNVALYIRILDYANRDALLAQLKAWFQTGTRGNLVSTFAVDGEDYYLPCVVQSAITTEGDQRFTVILQSEATAWRAVTADTDATWSATGAGGTHDITVEGDDETRLSMTFTPSNAPPDGYLHQNLYRLVPPNGVTVGLRSWCIQLDTAALVTAGKMLASCFDLRIWLDDAETRRWIDSPNTNHTNIWFNVDERKGTRLALRTAVAATGDVTRLLFRNNPTNRALIASLPSSGIFYHGTEWFSYVATNANACMLTVGERGIFNTTKQAHSIGDNFDFIPAAIRVVYGNTAATDPALDDDTYDDTKPLWSLASSDNTKRVWTATDLFFDPAHPNRPGGWVQSIIQQGTLSKLYWIKQDSETGDPALGMKLAAYKAGATWRSEKATAAWVFADPVGISKVTVTGEKYRNTGRWPDTLAAIQRSADGVTWFTVFNEATPGSASSWTALTNNSAANTIATTTKQVRAVFSQLLTSWPNAYAMFEILTATIEVTSANLPVGTLLGEQLNYPLNLTITNNATGEAISLKYPMRLDQVFVLDGEANSISYHKTNAFNALSLDDNGRSIWLRLVKGANQLQVSGDALGTLAIGLSWYRRRL